MAFMALGLDHSLNIYTHNVIIVIIIRPQFTLFYQTSLCCLTFSENC